MNDRPLSNAELVERIKEIGPWHMGVQLNDELNTGMVFAESGEIVERSDNVNDGISLLQLRDSFLRQIDGYGSEA